ncbi:MAG: methyltransferase domain-containing protein [Frankia sp.]|nr:methyltransferase domain-containing protein [Frankia sp.]
MPDALSINEIYEAGAPVYDALWANALLPITRRIIDRMDLAGRTCVLDLASGTGKALQALRAAAPGASIVAFDRSRAMLRVRPPGFPAAECDLAQLALGDDVADAGLLAFALFHLPDPARALREAARVLRPGSQLGLAVWAAQRGVPPMDAAWVDALDRRGAPVIDSPPRTDELMDTPEKLSGLLRAAGFREVSTWGDAIEWRPATEEYVAYRTGMGVFGRRYAALGPDAQHTFIDDARARLEALPAAQRVDHSPTVCAVATR